jgi:hypothetical protein
MGGKTGGKTGGNPGCNTANPAARSRRFSGIRLFPYRSDQFVPHRRSATMP